MYIAKKLKLRSIFILTNLVQLLLVYLKPCETYAVIDTMITISKEQQYGAEHDALRWYFTLS